MALKSKHAFGSEASVDSAILSGTIGAYDILFLSEGKIGWIDKNGSKIILEDKEQVILAHELPSTGIEDVLYIHNNTVYLWNGDEFIPSSAPGGISEEAINQKINTVKNEIMADVKAYADEQLSVSTAYKVVEF